MNRIKKDEVIYVEALSLSACGDAFLLYNKQGAVLIDTGEAVDQELVISILRKCGVTNIDAMILSHYDKDHVGGVPAILENFTVKTCYMPVGSKESPDYENMKNSLDQSDTEQIVLEKTESFICMGAEFIIYPPLSTEFQEKEDNNISLITSISYGESSLLFTGDAMWERMDQFFESQYDGREYRFLKIPHHGRNKRNVSRILDHFIPKAVLITSSPEELEKNSLVKFLTRRNIHTYLTRNGRIRMTVYKDHIQIVQYV